MFTITERLAYQGGRFAAFAEIELSVAVEGGTGMTTVQLPETSDVHDGAYYIPVIQTGALLAVRLAQPAQRVAVTVHRLVAPVADSTELLILYASARAVLRGLGAAPSLAGSIDYKSRSVTLPL